MEFKPCIYRNKMGTLGIDGVKGVVFVCACKQCSLFTTHVTPEACDGCPFRKKKPPKPVGEIVPKLDFPDCQDRITIEVIPACCSGPTEGHKCKSRRSPQYNKLVTPSLCRICTHQRPKPSNPGE